MKSSALLQLVLVAALVSSAVDALELHRLLSARSVDVAATEADATEADETEADETEAANTPVTSEPPDCPNLNIKHSGYKAIQELNRDIFVPEDTYPSGENTTNNECPDLPKTSTGKQFNWWQILVELGGEPGTLKGVSGEPDDTPPKNPCDRPLYIDDYEKYLYEYTDTDFKTFYRREKAYPRFSGSSAAFNDIRGELIWMPPAKANDTRGYSISYTVDDTGFWVSIDHKNCSFEPDKQTATCLSLPFCYCTNGKVGCFTPYGFNQILLSSLVGGG